MDDGPALLHVQDGLATITLNRPAVANALDLGLVGQLLEISRQCEGDRTIRAVLLRGAGPHFCVGGDINAFLPEYQAGRMREYARSIAGDLHLAISRLHRLNAPMVAAVQGAAAGAGLSLVCAADLVVAADDARFCVGYAGIGVTMDGGLSYFLPKIVGRRRSLELALTNRVLPADQALEWGLVNEVVRAAELDARATGLARILAAGPTAAYAQIRELFDGGWRETLETELELEARSIAGSFDTRDGQEGVVAFAAKRATIFLGE